MTPTDFLCLTPLLIVASAPVIMMLTLTVARNFRVIYGFSIFMFLAAFVSLFFIFPDMPHRIEPLIIMDHYAIVFLGTILFTCIMITMLSFTYFRLQGIEKEEYFIVLFVAALGASILVTAQHFTSFFLGLETLSISLYILIAYLKYRDYSVEASIKFLVIASVATAFLLFGMALIYAATGSMSFSGIAQAVVSKEMSPLLLTGTGMMLAGIGFKLALVPFHMWAPDVYEGAPAPVTTFIATISKGAIIAVALRFFMNIRAFENQTLIVTISIIAVLSMFAGNFLALQQTNIKRLLAYSSIAHMGYLLITLLTGTVEGIHAAIFYVISYTITSLGAFGVLSILSDSDHDTVDMNRLKGLFFRNPWIAIVLSLSMFSLAGIPLTAGFIAKFYVVLEGLRSNLWLLAVSLVVNTVISLYYYLRIIKTMFTESGSLPFRNLPVTGHVVLAVVAAAILLLGILPSFLTVFLNNIIR